jgi:tetratricopeptide (TPR) repeat protein
VKTLPIPKQSTLTPGHFVFAGVFLLRLVVLVRLSNSAFFLPARGDMSFYNDWALRILRGDLTDHAAFYGLPLYAYLLAFLYKLFGFNPLVPGLLQALLDAGTGLLIYKLASQILATDTSDRPLRSARSWFALLAVAGWAFFVPAQAYSIVLMPTAWLTFVFWFVVWRLVRTECAPTAKECLLLGLLIGVCAMGVATILFLVPLVLAALLLKPKIESNRSRTTFAIGGALLFAGVLGGTSPCWIHNYFIARDPVFLSAHSGVNFWIGNNPDANGYPRFPPGLRAGQAAMLQDSITAAESASGRSLKRGEVSAFWSAKAKNYIAYHPGEWLALLMTKLRNLISAFQYDDLSLITTLREQGTILPGLYFGAVAAFGLPGVFLAWRLPLRSRWIIAAMLLHVAALLTVFVTERYRLPLVPGLLVFGVLGLFYFWQNCVLAKYRRAAIYILSLAGATLLVCWPQRNPALWGLDAYNSGWQALESNNLSLAEKKLSLARAYVPDNAETNFALGNLRSAQGDREKAKAFYLRALEIEPRHKGAANNLGVIAMEGENFPEAQLWFERALAVAPREAKTHYLLAKTLQAEGNFAAAKVEIEQAIHLNPAQPEFVALRDEIRRSVTP